MIRIFIVLFSVFALSCSHTSKRKLASKESAAAKTKADFKKPKAGAVSIKSLLKAAVTIHTIGKTISKFSPRKKGNKTVPRKFESEAIIKPTLPNCSRQLNNESGPYCILRLSLDENQDKSSHNIEVVNTEAEEYFLTFNEYIIGSPYNNKKNKEIKDYKQLAEFVDECKQNYTLNTLVNNNKVPLKNFSILNDQTDPQLYKENDSIYKLTYKPIVDITNNRVCIAKKNTTLTNSKTIYQYSNNKATTIPYENSSKLLIYEVTYSTPYTFIKQAMGDFISKDKAKRISRFISKLQEKAKNNDLEIENESDRLRLHYIANRACNRFAKNLRLNNSNIVYAFCKKSNFDVFNSNFFAKSQITVLKNTFKLLHLKFVKNENKQTLFYNLDR